MDELLGDTQDLIAVGATHPNERALPAAEVEATIRCRGTTWIISGTTLIVTDALAVLTTAALAGPLDPTIALLICLAAMLPFTAGGALVTAGGIEWTQRPTRTLIRAAMARAETNGTTAEANRDLTNQLIEDIEKLRRQMGDRLDRLEKRIGDLPDYGAGVIDGLQMRSEALGDGRPGA